jgi:hypothetical protein
MSYIAKIRTGNGPLTIKINKPTFVGGYKFKMKKGTTATARVFETLPVDPEVFEKFLAQYVVRRKLLLGFDEYDDSFVTFNPRYETFRFAHLEEHGYNLLSIVDPEFITITRK